MRGISTTVNREPVCPPGDRFHMTKHFIHTLLLLFLIYLAPLADAGEIRCAGDYQYHLQGICTGPDQSIYWSFTTDLVKTDDTGKVQQSIKVEITTATCVSMMERFSSR